MAVKITNLGKFCTLLLLLEKPVHGYELIKQLGQRIGGRASPGQVYPFLKQLEKNRLVTSRRAGARDKRVYALTLKGRKFAVGMLDRLGDTLDAALKSRLTNCFHCDCQVYRGGVKKRVRGRQRMFCCEACAGSC